MDVLSDQLGGKGKELGGVLQEVPQDLGVEL